MNRLFSSFESFDMLIDVVNNVQSGEYEINGIYCLIWRDLACSGAIDDTIDASTRSPWTLFICKTYKCDEYSVYPQFHPMEITIFKVHISVFFFLFNNKFF